MQNHPLAILELSCLPGGSEFRSIIDSLDFFFLQCNVYVGKNTHQKCAALEMLQ